MILRTLPLLALVPAILWSADTVFVTRHAERAGGTGDTVPISEAGQCRAENLAQLLGDANIKAIFTSDVLRTQQTAAPLAKRLGISVVPIAAQDITTLADKVRSTGGNVLIVGHSNTVPAIVKAIGSTEVSPIADDEFSRVYAITLTSSGPSVVLLRSSGCSK